MEITIVEERPDSEDARTLIAELDAVLAPEYPPESRHGFSVEKLLQQGVHFFVMRADGEPAGCGGILFVASGNAASGNAPSGYAEVKRMYLRPPYRGSGLAKRMLDHLAEYSRQHGVTVLRLETGIYQVAAIKLYEQAGFRRIPPFGPYREDPVSLCYEKQLS